MGEAAQEALNVFHPLTYEGYVDIDAMTDEVLKASTICQIHNFGQVRALYTLHFTLYTLLEYTVHTSHLVCGVEYVHAEIRFCSPSR